SVGRALIQVQSALEGAQRKAENYCFDIRKQLFEYDQVGCLRSHSVLFQRIPHPPGAEQPEGALLLGEEKSSGDRGWYVAEQSFWWCVEQGVA
ncbi:unnamed protein product, partial [Closterium sp. NIES-53]